MAINDFLPFCNTNTGTNLLTESEYTAATDRVSGNKPGIASAKLNNKALRQGTAIAAALAQAVADNTGTDVLDDGNIPKLVGQVKAALSGAALPPVVSRYITGSGSHQLTYIFAISAGNATAGATYTNNSATFTVVSTIVGGSTLVTTGSGAPAVAGILTKASGTGDATLSFFTVKAPIYMHVEMVGAGGGGGANNTGNTGPSGGNGSDTNFGSMIAGGGDGGGGATALTAAAGGVASGVLGSPLAVFNGQNGGGLSAQPPSTRGPDGASTPFGGAGMSSYLNGGSAIANTGSGGAGAGANTVGSNNSANSGAAGAYIKTIIFTPSPTYGYAIGIKGIGATGTCSGGDGADGMINVIEYFQ